MNIFDFMANAPFTTLFLAVVAAHVVEIVVFRLPNRFFRSLNIKRHGWPPAHCDADGDFKPEEDGE